MEPHPPIYAKTFCSQACRDASACASCLSNIAIFLSLAKHSSQKPKLVRCPGALNDSALLIASSGDRLLRPRVRPHVCGRCLPWQAPQKIVMVPSPTTALHRHHGDCWAAAARGAIGEVQYRYYSTRPSGTYSSYCKSQLRKNKKIKK